MTLSEIEFSNFVLTFKTQDSLSWIQTFSLKTIDFDSWSGKAVFSLQNRFKEMYWREENKKLQTRYPPSAESIRTLCDTICQYNDGFWWIQQSSFNETVKPAKCNPAKWGHPCEIRTPYLSGPKLNFSNLYFFFAVHTLKRGHCWSKNTLCLSQRCPYFTGFIVYNNGFERVKRV
jgi:hypothetical protein